MVVKRVGSKFYAPECEGRALLRSFGLKKSYFISPFPNRTMFPEFEGSWNEVFDVVKRATEAVEPFGSRVSLVIKADIRPGFTGELDGKLERLEAVLEDTQVTSDD